MSGTKIRGITVELGGDTSGLSKALKDVNKEIRDTQSQLRDVERLLKLDPTNMELLRQKYSLLNREIGQTETKLEALKNAEKKVQEQFKKGEVSEDQYNALKREIISTESKLKSLQGEADNVADALKRIDEKPIEEVADAAQKAEKELEDAGKEASNFKDYLKAEAIVEGAKGIVSALGDVAEESKEYMKIMGSLEESSKSAGYSAEQTKETYQQLYGVLGDDQTAATATANLQALGLSQKDLTSLTNGTIGAWAKYGDSIPIDGLAEAINETVKVGNVTGTFADVLNWAGTSEDDFNEKLSKCGTEAERANLVMEELANQGLIQTGEAWAENNKVLVENNKAQAEMQEQLAELGETIMPFVTQITELATAVLGWFNSLDSGSQTAVLAILAIVATAGPVSEAFQGVGGIIDLLSSEKLPTLAGMFDGLTNTVLPAVGNAFSNIFGFIISNPIVLITAAIVGLVTLLATKGDEIQEILQKVDDFLQNIFATDFTEILGPVLGGVLNDFMQTVKDIWDGVKQIFDGIIDFIRGVFTGDWERAWDGIKKILGGVWDTMVSLVKNPVNSIIGAINGMIRGVVSGINTVIQALNRLKIDIPDWVPKYGGKKFGFNIKTLSTPQIPYLAKGGTLYEGSAIVGEAGPELLTVSGNKAVVQPLTSQQSKTTNLGGVNIVVYGSPGQDIEELAEILMDKFEETYERKEAVYG